jgi:PAS domain S-box-containing protein
MHSRTAAPPPPDALTALELRAAEAEALFHSLAEGSLQGVAIHDGTRPVFVNQAYAHMMGYPDAAAARAGISVERHVMPEDIADLQAEWRRILAGGPGGPSQRHRRRRVDGRVIWIDLVMRPVSWQGRPAVQAVAVEVTREVAAEAELEHSVTHFRELAAASLQGIVIHDGRRCLFANDAFAHMMGFADARAAIALPDVAELVFPADRPAVRAEWQLLLAGERTWSRQREQRQRADGSLIWLDTFHGPVVWFGRPAVEVVQIEVTREVEAEAELRRSEARFRAVIDNLPAVLTVKDTDRRFRIVNPAFERWQGVDAAVAIGRTPEDLRDMGVHSALPSAEVVEDDVAVMETGQPIIREARRLKRDGESREVFVTKFAIRAAGGKIDGVGTVYSDITELKQAQAQIERRETELRRNQAAILKVLRDELSGGSIADRIRRILALAGETLGVDLVTVWQLDRAAQTVRCIERWRAPHMPAGEALYPIAVPSADTDIFYRVIEDQIVLALDRERRPAALADILDKHFGALDISASLTALVRLPDRSLGHISLTRSGAPRSWSVEDESFARSIAELIHICFLQAALESRGQALRRNHETLARMVREGLLAGGTPREILDAIAQIACATLGIARVGIWNYQGPDEPANCRTMWDSRVNRHLRLPEAEMSYSARQMRSWFTPEFFERQEHDLVVAIDDVTTDPLVGEIGHRHCREHGIGGVMIATVRLPDRVAGTVSFSAGPGPHRWSAEDQVFARSVADLVAFAFLFARHRQALAALDLVNQGLYVEDRNGEVIYANRVARRLAGADDGGAVPLDALPALTGGVDPEGDVAGEMIWRTPAGERLELVVARTALPEEGAVTLIADISERKQRERERLELEAEMRQAAKLEAVGRLASGIAHDFNNLLGAILGFAGFLQEDLPPDSPQHGYAARITRASEHAKEVVKQLLAFTRATDVERRTMDLAALVADSAELLRASLPSSTRLAVDCGTAVLPAMVNSGQIHQILLNLCINANDALDGQPGTIALSLARIDAGLRELPMPGPRDGGGVAASGHLRPDRAYARLTVADEGSGMDAATLGRVFDPFFTTKGPGRGTGLGLAVVYGIVNAYDGALTVESWPGGGTTFSIYLPLATDAPPEIGEARPADRARGSETVLLVDDEADLLEMMRIGLTRLGYDVTACSDPLAALELFRADPAHWDAVVTDQVMPGMKGFTLIGKLRAIRPDCPIILCTGFNDGATERQATEAGANGFFLKPIEPYRIAETIRTLRGE